MKIKKIVLAGIACAVMGTAAFSAHAIGQAYVPQEVRTVSYDSAALAEFAEQVAVLVNQERAANGLQPVKFSPLLSQAANIRSGELQENFSHTRPDGTSCFTVLDELGISYRSAAENIAYGQRSPESVMDAWMNSSGHRANILSGNMEYIGVGVVYRDGVYYWTQLFAASADLAGDAYLPGVDSETPGMTTTEQETTAQTTTAASVQTETTEPPVTAAPMTTEQTTFTETAATEEIPETEPEAETTVSVQTTAADTVITTETTTETTVCPPASTEETATTCRTEIPEDCTVITKPAVTLPVSGDCAMIGGGAVIVIAPNA